MWELDTESSAIPHPPQPPGHSGPRKKLTIKDTAMYSCNSVSSPACHRLTLLVGSLVHVGLASRRNEIFLKNIIFTDVVSYAVKPKMSC